MAMPNTEIAPAVAGREVKAPAPATEDAGGMGEAFSVVSASPTQVLTLTVEQARMPHAGHGGKSFGSLS